MQNNFRSLLYVLVISVFCFNVRAQNNQPVVWTTKVEQLSDNKYFLVFKADIEAGWYVYSQEPAGESGPIPTTFEYVNTDGNYKLIGKTTEPEGKTEYDKIFEANIKKFTGSPIFRQTIQLINPKFNTVEVSLEYQVCDDEKCLMKFEEFTLSLDGSVVVKKKVELDERSKAMTAALDLNITGWDKHQFENIEQKSNATIFLLGFLGGFIALLTPCVFPMIPLTVSFFTKKDSYVK